MSVTSRVSCFNARANYRHVDNEITKRVEHQIIMDILLDKKTSSLFQFTDYCLHINVMEYPLRTSVFDSYKLFKMDVKMYRNNQTVRLVASIDIQANLGSRFD